ncbi:acyltransferase [Pseudomonas sp. St386]|uniref:acyltransferase family protein n=1 Tax=Pseudomonas sp. St386 TaxID=2678256 RepID=UPI001BB32AA3|nr:acyltransferase family protein [Pseudomonas sp. St386]BBP51256.1 acyltransferase [Pseudomonas sp. St386]
MTSSLQHPKYRPDIDGLRAIAVLSVVVFHAFPTLLRGGFIGVDIFFVISGFLISTIIFKSLDAGSFSFSEFYARRVKRIFPALLAVLVFCYVFGWYSLLADEYAQLGKHIASGAGFVSNLTLLRESGYFDNSAETKPLLHLWSLGIEEQFYLFWPVAVFVAWKLRSNLLALTAILGAAFFALNLNKVGQDPVSAFYSPQTRFWELLCGSMLAWCAIYLPASKAMAAYSRLSGSVLGSNIKSLLGVLLLALGFLFISKEGFPGKWALIPVCGAVLIISAGPSALLNRYVLSNKILVWFGLISFPLYLWHWPLLTFARIIEGGTPSILSRVASVAASIALAWMTYKIIEQPLRRSDGQYKAVALCGLMAAVGAVGFVTYSKDGLAGRQFPQEVAAHMGAVADYKTTMKIYGLGKCFIDYDQNVDVLISNKCDQPVSSGRRLVIFGDSEAAHLMGGVRKVYADAGFDIGQWTGTSCRPFDFFVPKSAERCTDFSGQFVNAVLPTLKKGDVLIVGANWIGSFKVLSGDVLMKSLNGFFDSLGKTPATVVVFGNTPDFYAHPVQSIARKISFSSESRYLNTLDYRGSNTIIKDLSVKRGFTYFNPSSALCKPESPLECMAYDGKNLTFFDPGHLAEAGSERVLRKFAEDVDIKTSLVEASASSTN